MGKARGLLEGWRGGVVRGVSCVMRVPSFVTRQRGSRASPHASNLVPPSFPLLHHSKTPRLRHGPFLHWNRFLAFSKKLWLIGLSLPLHRSANSCSLAF